jgi:aspartate carbamoyltransferase
VDLIAPEELGMPENYIARMKENGFKINIFLSIEEYLSSHGGTDGKGRTAETGNGIAPIWYFTRPQLERMGENILKRQTELRSKITFKKEFLNLIPENTVFYHPLPRHKLYPTIPVFLDSTPLNGWEVQSANGKLIRIVLLGLVAGVIGDDFEGKSKIASSEADGGSFIEELPVGNPAGSVKNGEQGAKDYAEGVKPISNGVVIDHICRGENEKDIRENLAKVIRVLELYGKGGEWISSSRSERDKMKGIIFRPGYPELEIKKMKQLAAFAPECTLNITKEKKVVKKLKLHMPPKIYNFPNICCKNHNCISHIEQGENVPAEFYRIAGDKFKCKYCDETHTFKEIWL